MDSTDDLIAALREEGIAPTETAVMWLDAQISELAELLVDYHLSSDDGPPEDHAALTRPRATVRIRDK